jgi:hypothetical protein
VIKYYSAMQKKEILSHATTWVNFKDSVLSETSQSQKDKYFIIPVIQGPRVVKFIDTENRRVVVRG